MAATSVASCSSLVPKSLSISSSYHHSSLGRRNHQVHFVFGYPSSSIFSLSTVAFARRKNNTPAAITSNKKKKSKNKILPQNGDAEGENVDEDAIEALFNLLEEDLKNDLSGEGDDEVTEDDLAKLERELEEAFGNDDELSGMLSSYSENSETDDDDNDEEDDDADETDNDDVDDDDDDNDEEERSIELKKWQLRRLASALKIGRRKTSIKSLAAELCLDRAVVLALLRDPPPDLLLLSAALPDRVVQTPSEPEIKPMEASTELIDDVLKPEPEEKLPVHVKQSRWSMQKRLKKVQIQTLERVYSRSKRPTNAMVSSIVHVTNLPRKRIVQWFEEKRDEEGIPHKRLPFQRTSSETLLSN